MPSGQATSISRRRTLSVRAAARALEHAPITLRTLVRTDEIGLLVVASVLGIAAGLLVIAINGASQRAHEWLYGLEPGARLSASVQIPPAAAAIPALGGIVLAMFSLLARRFTSRRAVDPIEANALYGGRMSLGDSVVVVMQTLISNGFGASVGLEAAYTQIGGAIGSRIGRAFRVRRADQRVLVGCGTAGAIAAAFHAPLTGAFYAFELVIGTYTLGTLAPVVAAAITAVSIQQILIGGESGFEVGMPAGLPPSAILPVLALGVACALAGILIMRAVTLTESAFRHILIPAWARPALGGLAVGGLALLSPSVLSSGHGALRAIVGANLPLATCATLLALKAAASSISIGSGFRGGLFFASLLMGALLGKAFAALMLLASPTPMLPEVAYGLVGMSGLAVAIVGGPLTMAFLALEGTGSLPLTVAVLGAAVISSITVRRTFGYSFATWRFHLRGESIRSAVDVGWVRNLTAGRMMRRDFPTVRADAPLAQFRRDFPLGSTARVIALDERERYAGIVTVADAHAAELEATRVSEVLHAQKQVLLPEMTVKETVAMFEQAEADALAVVDGADTLRVLGLLTEQHALRRYAEELDRRRRDLSGE